jgi:hypothetical protein
MLEDKSGVAIKMEAPGWLLTQLRLTGVTITLAIVPVLRPGLLGSEHSAVGRARSSIGGSRQALPGSRGLEHHLAGVDRFQLA